MTPIPKSLELAVFDLDFTFWDGGGTWCDCLQPPFREHQGEVSDRRGRIIRVYPDLPEILDYLERGNVQLALASRTHEPDWARELLDLLGYAKRFPHQEIYPGSKTAHFQQLREETGIAYESMLFFDDEKRNIEEVGELGVHCLQVKNGTDWESLRRGFSLFPKR